MARSSTTSASVSRFRRSRRSSTRAPRASWSRRTSAAGRLLEKEISVRSGLLEQPERPYVAAVGGAKVGDKLGVLDNLLKVVDRLLIGGAMCFTFFLAQGRSAGTSLVEPGHVAQ